MFAPIRPRPIMPSCIVEYAPSDRVKIQDTNAGLLAARGFRVAVRDPAGAAFYRPVVRLNLETCRPASDGPGAFVLHATDTGPRPFFGTRSRRPSRGKDRYFFEAEISSQASFSRPSQRIACRELRA